MARRTYQLVAMLALTLQLLSQGYIVQHIDGHFLTKSRDGGPDEVVRTATSPDQKQEQSEDTKKASDEGKKAKDTKKASDEDKWAKDRHTSDSKEGAEETTHAKQYRSSAKHKEPKYPIIARIGKQMQIFIGKYSDVWYEDWKLWVGLLLWIGVWASWIYFDNMLKPLYWEQSAWVFGINVMILHHLQYSSNTKSGMIAVVSFIGLQTLFYNVLWYRSEKHGAESEEEEPPSDFECDTLYLDIGLPFEQILVLFTAQVFIWWFYITSIVHNFEFGDLEDVSYAFWLVAFLSMQITMIFNRGEDSVLGNPFPIHDVDRLVRHAAKGTFKLMDSDDAAPFTIGVPSMILRSIMGFWCNSILREIMSYTIPLMLMDFDEPMDFVVYCVGVNFICTLDDMTPRKYSLRVGDAPHDVAEDDSPPPERKRSFRKTITGLR